MTLDQNQNMDLLTCKSCIHSRCNGRQINKCNSNDLVCSLDSNTILDKLANGGTCQMNYWYSSKKSGCGCGK